MVRSTGRELVVLHVAFVVVAGVALLLPGQIGWRVAMLLLVYDVALLALAILRRDRELLRLWVFAAVLSVWQVIPDVFLVDGLGVLAFPDDGFPNLGPVTGTMAALWTVPVVVVVAIGTAVERRYGSRAGTGAAAGAALLVFLAGELALTSAGLWQARGVPETLGVAHYILPAEILFGVSALRVFHALTLRSPVAVVPATLLVSVLYTGAAAVSWLVLGR